MRRKKNHSTKRLLALGILSSSLAQAGDYLKAANDYLDGNAISIPAEVWSKKGPYIKVTHLASDENSNYEIDVSGFVKNAAFEKLFKASINFPDYKVMGIPNLDQIAVFDSNCAYQGAFSTENPPSQLITWSQMTYTSFRSSHFLEVKIHPMKKNGALKSAGTSWNLSQSKCSGYADESLFSKINGSWYIAEAAPQVIYMRYYLSVTMQEKSIKSFAKRLLASWTPQQTKRQVFSDGAQAVLRKISDYALK